MNPTQTKITRLINWYSTLSNQPVNPPRTSEKPQKPYGQPSRSHLYPQKPYGKPPKESKNPSRSPVKPSNDKHKYAKLLKHFQKTKRRNDIADPTHPSSITTLEIKEFITKYGQKHNLNITLGDITNSYDLIGKFLPRLRTDDIILENITIRYLTADGHGIAIVPKATYAAPYVVDPEELLGKFTIFLVPKTVVGDKVNILIKMHHEYYAEGALMEVTNSDSRQSRRNNGLVVCQHFDKCNGCQLQMLSYEDQLRHKQSIIKKAYRFFYPDITKHVGEEFGTVMGSPLQYTYRTKLTPHFSFGSGVFTGLGFESVSNQGRIDVKQCPIATPEINDKITEMRDKFLGQSKSTLPYTQLTLRQSTRINNDTGSTTQVALEGQYKVITEKVNDFVFQFDGNCFFQNNNAILPSVLDYITYHTKLSGKLIDNLVDAYCGVGFFGIALSNAVPETTKIFGIELSKTSIKYANHNVKINYLDQERIKFIQGDAASMFRNEEFMTSGILGKNSVVIIDPSRKGSNEMFLKQLLEFEPELIVYISCNVFTQARDLATFAKLQKEGGQKYRVRDIMGFDFFPQTKHVESVAIIEKV
ncbi:tRNA (uracil(54)-C(5))-methyltransferase [Candida viswanathii]|uniref:tRNA (Uracil(54)-C(5))-methyltransferase n=1 Tax=Candida viswanathii TaxID=5486 RepID=A0A367Y1J6_9ASCO|nr:tRNA (uracil(54)-C(5))-methyltransferase [Candida viswanathii]